VHAEEVLFELHDFRFIASIANPPTSYDYALELLEEGIRVDADTKGLKVARSRPNNAEAGDLIGLLGPVDRG
jgi:hypothetical protein